MNQLKEKNKNGKKGKRRVYETTWEENTTEMINVKGQKPYSCSYCEKSLQKQLKKDHAYLSMCISQDQIQTLMKYQSIKPE